MVDKAAFLAAIDWQNATATSLAGDASRRSYERLRKESGESAVLMIAPPGSGEDIAPFIKIARHLHSIGLGAPRILASNRSEGFLLLEDFGDALFARVAERDPALEGTLYQAAADVLLDLQKTGVPEGVPAYDETALAEAAMLSIEWYAPAGTDGTDLAKRIAEVVAALDNLTDVLALRDYHAENLIWLPDRPDIRRVGLLDFQDAMAGHPAYDLVSLLQDARRDVSPDVAAKTMTHVLNRSGREAEAFERAYATLGAQRNLRILGVFARLCLRDEKASYLTLIPRVWGHLQTALSHPRLDALGREVGRCLPPPSPKHLADLEARCGQMRQ